MVAPPPPSLPPSLLRRGVGALPPHHCLIESVASYLCHSMLTCDIPMTHHHGRPEYNLSKRPALQSTAWRSPNVNQPNHCSLLGASTGTRVSSVAVDGTAPLARALGLFFFLKTKGRGVVIKEAVRKTSICVPFVLC